jgi:hypothetical protein
MIFQAHTRNNFLTEIAADGSLVPELATGWEATPDATEWTFNIREGVQFHSGHILTAEDVVASINHHRGPDSTSAAAPIVAGSPTSRRRHERDFHAGGRQCRLPLPDVGLPPADPARTGRRHDRPQHHRWLRALPDGQYRVRRARRLHPPRRLLERGPALFRRHRADPDLRRRGASERADLGRGGLHRRGRSQHRCAPGTCAGDQRARRHRHPALRLPDGHAGGALR